VHAYVNPGKTLEMTRRPRVSLLAKYAKERQV
jgi:hypothetical protein